MKNLTKLYVIMCVRQSGSDAPWAGLCSNGIYSDPVHAAQGLRFWNSFADRYHDSGDITYTYHIVDIEVDPEGVKELEQWHNDSFGYFIIGSK